jgi:hypothetical protein
MLTLQQYELCGLIGLKSLPTTGSYERIILGTYSLNSRLCVTGCDRGKHPCLQTVAALNTELQCNIYCLFSLNLRFWRVQ